MDSPLTVVAGSYFRGAESSCCRFANRSRVSGIPARLLRPLLLLVRQKDGLCLKRDLSCLKFRQLNFLYFWWSGPLYHRLFVSLKKPFSIQKRTFQPVLQPNLSFQLWQIELCCFSFLFGLIGHFFDGLILNLSQIGMQKSSDHAADQQKPGCQHP